MATNTLYDSYIETARAYAYNVAKAEIAAANPSLTGSALNAVIANVWNQSKDDRTKTALSNFGYPSAVTDYYDDNWSSSDTSQATVRANRPTGGNPTTSNTNTATSNIIPTIASMFSGNVSGPVSASVNELPVDMGDNAFIAIDKNSFGGRKWVEKAQSSGITPTDKLMFQFLGNGEFPDNVTAEFNTHDVLGRSESYYTYERTSNREFSVTLKFIAQGLYGDDSRGILREVKMKCDWCRALMYPSYEGGLMYPPPILNVGFGSMFSRNGAAVRCLATSVSVTYNSDDAPLDTASLAPYAATIDISFIGAFITNASADMLEAKTILSGNY